MRRWQASENAARISGRPRFEKRPLSPIPGLRGIWTSCPAGHPLQTKTFDTRAAAEQWARAVEVEMDQGIFVSRAEAESTTLKELLDRYLKEVTPLKKGAAPEATRIKALLRHPLAQRIVATLRSVDIARYRDERLKQVSPATAKRGLVILAHLFEVARKEWGIQMHNPVRDIKLPPNNKARDRRLQAGRDGQDSEEARLLKASREARNPYLLPVVRLALETARWTPQEIVDFVPRQGAALSRSAVNMTS